MNNIPLQLPSSLAPVTRSCEESSPEAVEFLSLRLLHKRNRVQFGSAFDNVSSLPGRLSLFASANWIGWFGAIAKAEDGNYQLRLSPLRDLRQIFASDNSPANERLNYSCQKLITLPPSTPVSLKFAMKDERLIIATREGNLMVYDTPQLLSSPDGISEAVPLKIFEGLAIGDLAAHPETDLIAVLRSDDRISVVEVVDVSRLSVVSVWSPEPMRAITPVSISWSAKGKQLAIGLSSGDIVTYLPSEPREPKSFFPRPESSESSAVTSLSWLTNTVFHLVLGSLSSTSPANSHFVSIHEPKTFSARDVRLDDPCPPFGAVERPSAPQTLILRNWNPFKYLIFVADGPASEIGVVANMTGASVNSDEKWTNLILDEGAAPSLPLDESLNETALLGLDLDLTSTEILVGETKTGEEMSRPAGPILYAYASDGTLVGWHIFNDRGGRYPGMIAEISSEPAQLTSNKDPRLPPFSISERSLSQQPELKGRTSIVADPPSRSPSPPGSVDNDMDDSALDGLSLGESKKGGDNGVRPGPSIFGTSSSSVVSSGFGSASSSGIRPGSGFGAFGNSAVTNSPFTASKSNSSPGIAFGASGFFSAAANSGNQVQSPPATAFGSSGFSAPRQPSSSFGSSGFAQPKSMPGIGTGGFGAFANKTQSFGSGFTSPPSNKPAGSGGEAIPSGTGFASFAGSAAKGFGLPAGQKPVLEPQSEAKEGTNESSPPITPITSNEKDKKPDIVAKPSVISPAIGFSSKASPPSPFAGKPALSASTESPSFVSAFGATSTTHPTAATPTTTIKSAAPSFGQSSFTQRTPTFGSSSSTSAKAIGNTQPQPSPSISQPAFGGFAGFAASSAATFSPGPAGASPAFGKTAPPLSSSTVVADAAPTRTKLNNNTSATNLDSESSQGHNATQTNPKDVTVIGDREEDIKQMAPEKDASNDSRALLSESASSFEKVETAGSSFASITHEDYSHAHGEDASGDEEVTPSHEQSDKQEISDFDSESRLSTEDGHPSDGSGSPIEQHNEEKTPIPEPVKVSPHHSKPLRSPMEKTGSVSGDKPPSPLASSSSSSAAVSQQESKLPTPFTPSPSPFISTPKAGVHSFGLGYPSSKPARSSPLAGGATPGDDMNLLGSSFKFGRETPSKELFTPKDATSAIPTTTNLSKPGTANLDAFSLKGSAGFIAPSTPPAITPSLPKNPTQPWSFGQTSTAPLQQRPSFLPPQLPSKATAYASSLGSSKSLIPEPMNEAQRSMQAFYESALDQLSKARAKLVDVESRSAASRTRQQESQGDVTVSLKGISDGMQTINEELDERYDKLEKLQNSLLKEEIQLQHIKRLEAALRTPHFSQIAELRSLNPDQLEQQEQLRRNVKDCESMTGQLESLLGDLRRKLEEQKEGRINLRSPSFASIDRTCQLLEMTIAALSHRIDNLTSVSKPSATTATKHKTKSTQPQRSRVISATVTKNVAAALQAAKISKDVKAMMLNILKEPLLTKKVVAADEAQDTGSTLPEFQLIGPNPFVETIKKPAMEEPSPVMHSSVAPIPWTLPPNTFSSPSPTTPLPSGRQGSAKKSAQHAKSVVHPGSSTGDSLRGPAVFSPPPGFSWGELPTKSAYNTPSPAPRLAGFSAVSPDLRPSKS